VLATALLAAIASLFAAFAVLNMWPIRRQPDEGWFDYFFRLYFVPGNALVFSVIGWMTALGRDDLGWSTEAYAVAVVWVIFLALPAVPRRRE
jgi:hypothetical protein